MYFSLVWKIRVRVAKQIRHTTYPPPTTLPTNHKGDSPAS
jgi:hypothetical protein